MVAKVQVAGRWFAWDDEKAVANIRKHNVDFTDAISAFADVAGVIREDEAHSRYERRCTWWGIDRHGRLLRISFCFRDGSRVIRIISARRASRSGFACYAEGKRRRP